MELYSAAQSHTAKKQKEFARSDYSSDQSALTGDSAHLRFYYVIFFMRQLAKSIKCIDSIKLVAFNQNVLSTCLYFIKNNLHSKAG